MQKQPDTNDGVAIYGRLLSYLKPYKQVFVAAIIAMVLFAATDASFAALLKPMLDGSFVEKDPFWISMVPVFLLAITLLRGVTGFVSNFSMSWISRKVIKELRLEMFNHLLRLPAGYYDSNASGQLISKFTFDVEQVAKASTQAITVAIRDSLTILGLLAWMLYLDWMLSLIFMVIGPFIAILVLYVNKRFRRIGKNIQASMGDVAHVSEEAIEGHRVVKTFGGHEYESQQFERANERNRKQQMKMVITSSLSVQIIMILASLALTSIVYLATLPSMLEKITVGGFMSFIVAMLMLLGPIKRLTTVNVAIQRGIAAATSLFSLIDTKPEIDTGTVTIDRAKGAVEFSHVTFSYDRSKGNALDDISFTIEPGQTVAFVGRSGSGKTTLTSLLPRFYDFESGNILLDGHDIRTIKLDNLRDQIALVGQHVTLFNDTIANNIAYGRLGETNEQAVVHAAEAAHAMEFIKQLPDGLDTLVGENGVLLSGGQRQRLAIARALLKDAPILILDEATASLDSESEHYIQQGLDALIQDRTTLVIAHRLSTIKHADKIIVMHEGRVVETGTHDDLLGKDGNYAALYRLQYQQEDENLKTVTPIKKEVAG